MQRATRARYWVIVFAVTLAVIQYIDRVCISKAMPAHPAGPALHQRAGGLRLRRVHARLRPVRDPRRLARRQVRPEEGPAARRDLVVVLHGRDGARGRPVSMVVVRFLFGAGEAGCFPNITKAFSTWLPRDERVRAQSVLWLAARWGGAATPLLVVGVLGLVSSWRRAFEVFGALGLVWAFFFYRWFRDNPHEHPSVNEAEKRLLTGVGKPRVAPRRACPGASSSVRARPGCCGLQYACLSYVWYFYVTWFPTYLEATHGGHPGPGDARRARRPAAVRRRLWLADLGLLRRRALAPAGRHRSRPQGARRLWLRRRRGVPRRVRRDEKPSPRARPPHRPRRAVQRLRAALRLGRVHGCRADGSPGPSRAR